MSDVNLTDTERDLRDFLYAEFPHADSEETEEIARTVAVFFAARDARVRAAALAPIQALAANLDRCGHGRHEGEDCSGCSGPSRGNPQDAVIVGFAVRGAPITVADLRSVLAAAGVDAAPNETAEIAERSDPAWTFDLMVKDGSITREAADLALGRMRQQDAGVVVPDSVWRARHSPSALAAALDEVRAQALRDAAANPAKALAHMPRYVAVPDTLLAQIDVLVSAVGPIPLVDDVLRGLDWARADRDRAIGVDPDRAAVPSGHEQEGDDRA